MRVRWLTTLAMAIVITGSVRPVPAGDKGDAVARDMKLLQGNWTLESFVANGKDVPAEKIQKIKLTIKGDRYLVDFGKQKMELKFTIDPTRKPKTMDLINTKDDKKTVTPGIYEITGDTLRICRGTETGQARPTEFAAKEGSKLALSVYRRDKK
jgi:uncharacterized protein (TIGR03067 family)